MTLLRNDEATMWVKDHGFALSPDTGFEGLPNKLSFGFPIDSGAKAALARLIASGFSGGEVLFWVSNHDIWPSSSCTILFERFRSPAASPIIGLEDAPGTLLATDEAELLPGCIFSALAFFWDALLFNHDGSLYVDFSHDGLFSMGSTNEAMLFEFQDAMRSRGYG